uniref:Uncharacterized protein n=1 Tax=Oryza rufipogon TaxID=4529 RepID=A0A0E0R9K0_ORYRU
MIEKERMKKMINASSNHAEETSTKRPQLPPPELPTRAMHSCLRPPDHAPDAAADRAW